MESPKTLAKRAELVTKMYQNFPESRHKFPWKREIEKPQISRKISRPAVQGENPN